MKEDATDTGVSTEDTDEQMETEEEIDEFEVEEQEPPKSAREIALESIQKTRLKQLKEDGYDVEIEDEEEDDPEKQDLQESEKEEIDESATSSPATVVAKVDGEEETLTQEELDAKLREYQKHKAADKRLEDAAKVQKEAAELKATLESKIEQAESFEVESDVLNDFIHDIREGDEEDAKKATEKLMEALTKKTNVSTRKLEALVSSKVDDVLTSKQEEERAAAAAEEAERLAKAQEWFNNTFSKELEDKLFKPIAIAYDDELKTDAEWQTKTFEERFEEAGKRAKAYMESTKAPKKLGKKKPHNIKSVSRKAPLRDVNDDKPPTTSGIIAEIARKRGQTHL